MRPGWCCAVVGLAATVALSAGEPVRQQPGGAAGGAQTSGRSGQPGTGKSITLDGCIQAAPAAQASSGVKYVLASRSAARGAGANAGGRGAGANAAGEPSQTNARGAATVTGADGDEPTGRASAAGPGGGALVRYPLDGDEKAIAPHLNHVVEIAGALQGAPPPPSTAAAGPGGATIGPTLKVESVKMVAAICP